jgi:hypothetical protein
LRDNFLGVPKAQHLFVSYPSVYGARRENSFGICWKLCRDRTITSGAFRIGQPPIKSHLWQVWSLLPTRSASPVYSSHCIFYVCFLISSTGCLDSSHQIFWHVVTTFITDNAHLYSGILSECSCTKRRGQRASMCQTILDPSYDHHGWSLGHGIPLQVSTLSCSSLANVVDNSTPSALIQDLNSRIVTQPTQHTAASLCREIGFSCIFGSWWAIAHIKVNK